jgi:folate-binding Fe-S cluster repair protein YgfZ
LAALLLAPNGEVVSSAHCVEADGGVDLVVRHELGPEVLKRLQRFLLRTRCELRLVEEVPGPYSTVGEQVANAEPGPAEFALGLAPQAFGAKFVREHVSFAKGCFTGQELVGRLDARSSNIPFRLAAVTGSDLNRMATVVRSAGPSGERGIQGLTTVVSRGAVLDGLAVVHRSLMGDESRREFDEVTISLVNTETID